VQVLPTIEDDRELKSLLDVGAALSSQHETHKILEMILEKAMDNTNSDSGSIYLIERVKQDSMSGARAKSVPMLRFHHALNMSNPNLKLEKQLLSLSNGSIAGYVALAGQSVRIRDVYALPKDCPFMFNSEWDKRSNYRTKSCLAVPIKTSRGKVLGVVQLINKKKRYGRRHDVAPPDDQRIPEKEIIAYSDHDDNLMKAFASHAAVALENAKLTEDIANLFESFVKASVMAIEARDPSTSGHSDRVARLTVRFAEVVDAIGSGSLKDIRFTSEQLREIRYASLLHDFGKIGVRESVLTKAQKLFPHELETVLLRLETIKALNEAKSWRHCAENVCAFKNHEHDHSHGHGHAIEKAVSDPTALLGKALWEIDQFNQNVEKIRRGIMKANESQVIDKDFDIESLIKWIKEMSTNIGQKILNDNEVVRLSVKRGTLSPEERTAIESHVTHTYEFLNQIAWTDNLQNVPDIAHAHHEKLDGTGYPRRLKADQIPVQSRMMAISDIYDALTAFDRPYKKAVDNTRALDILATEAKEGKLDRELLKVFIEAGVFEVTLPFKNKKAG